MKKTVNSFVIDLLEIIDLISRKKLKSTFRSRSAVDFFGVNAPASIGIVIDTSRSMVGKIDQMRTSVSQFIGVLNPSDDIILFAFSDKPFLLQPFTTDHALVNSRLENLHAFGRTAMYDSTIDALLMVARGHYRQKVVVLATDGSDTSSSSGQEQVIAAAHDKGAAIYMLVIRRMSAFRLDQALCQSNCSVEVSKSRRGGVSSHCRLAVGSTPSAR